MTAVLPEDVPRVLDAYRARRRALTRGSVDEILGAEGVLPAAEDLASTIEIVGHTGLLTRRAQVRRLVEDDGVTYGGAGDPRGQRRWSLDPLPVVLDAAGWSRLAPALVQRAELLDLVLTDLYGPRTLLRDGVVPVEVVAGHPGFLRAADRIRVPGQRQLFLAATDLARDASGQWCVLGDRTQAPSGAGYAMENRRVISRVLPGLYRDTPLARLRGFFHTMRAALQEVAPATAEAPRVVILAPGPSSETAFDQAFLATLLGFPLVEGEDLTVRDGRVWMHSLGKLEPVDVVLRRVDAAWADPLELRPESHLGVPGLIEAARLGHVTVVNPLGAGVLENPGLLPFLPAAARHLLDSDLALPSVPSWWCGDAASRRYVLEHLGDLVLKPIGRETSPTSWFGWELSAARREALRRRIEAQPWAWAAQEPLPMSTAPVVTRDGLDPRRLVLRTFAVAQGGAYRLMAGGLGRVAGRPESHLVSNLAGALAKDVWVLAPDPAEVSAGAVTLDPWTAPAAPDASPDTAVGAPDTGEAPSAALSPRVAEDLFWLGRYAERAEDTARLIRVVDDLAEDYSRRDGTPGSDGLAVLLRALSAVTASPVPLAADDLRRLVGEEFRVGGLAYAVRRTVDAAHAVREQLSLDTWLVLGSLQRTLAEAADAGDEGVPVGLQPTLTRVLEGLMALAGLGAESMIRDSGWYFMDAGRRLERAQMLVSLIRQTLSEQRSAAVDTIVVEGVLLAGESIITHRRRNPGGAVAGQVSGVLDLLLLDRGNPRSLHYQLERLAEDLKQLRVQAGPAATASAQLSAGLRDLTARLRELDVEAAAVAGADGVRAVVSELGAELARGLADLAAGLEAVHFVHRAPQRMLAEQRWSVGGGPDGAAGTGEGA
ncbi:MAG: circularly permuted type 2 ATP-grasp protein [Kineosporiaceae bacterium]